MASKPTQRSLKLLRDSGYRVAIVEHWNSFVKRRQDLFGFADLFAIHPEHHTTMLVQTTGGNGGNMNARLTKLFTERREEVIDCLKSGVEVHVHGWRLGGPRGKRKTWKPRIVRVHLGDGETPLEAWEEKEASEGIWELVKLEVFLEPIE